MDDFLRVASDLIKIPSTTDNPAALRRAIGLVSQQLTQTAGVHVHLFEHNGKPSLLAYTGNTRPHTFDVLLSGHLDVVPGLPEQFAPTVRDGRLYGRGAADMKATALGMATVFCELAPTVSYQLGLLLTTDEEIGGYDGAQQFVRQGDTARFVIVGESTGATEICTEYKGMAHVAIEFAGRRAHSSRPWEGKNAIMNMHRYIAAISAVYPDPQEAAWQTTAAPVRIATTNQAHNQIPADAILELHFRPIPGDPHFADKATLQAYLEGLLGDDEGHVTIISFDAPAFVDKQNPYLQQLAAAVQTVHNTRATFIRKHGSCDGRFFPAAVVYGMAGQGAHGDDEYLELDSAEPYLDALRSFLQNYSS